MKITRYVRANELEPGQLVIGIDENYLVLSYDANTFTYVVLSHRLSRYSIVQLPRKWYGDTIIFTDVYNVIPPVY